MSEWIEIKTRPLTEEEKEYYSDIGYMYDCEMPDGGQEILIATITGYVGTDIYLDDGHFRYFADDVVAWMPFPQPFKKGDAECL